MKQPKREKAKASLCPWALARLIATDQLSHNQSLLAEVMGVVRSRNLKQVAELGVILDQEYQVHTWAEILTLRQISALFKKNSAFSDEKRCSSAAQDSFKRGELICRIANKRLDYYWQHRDRVPADLLLWLDRMEKDVSDLLGDCHAKKLEKIFNYLPVTSGATEDRGRKRSMPFLKISQRVRCHPRAVPYVVAALKNRSAYRDSLRFSTTEYNQVVEVPKNWKTNRTIAKEPTHSVPFQLALDRYLKGRLRRWGVDLANQELSQEAARQGSLTGNMATVDLSMASDTLCYNLCAWMLSSDWLAVFSAFRSRLYRSPSGNGVYAKFSSMGNGTTFSLESMFFAAACRAVGSRDYRVYGDDIAIESDLVADLLRLLKFLGFRVNADKSFSNPACPFRESCGADYLKGEWVTPFYLREIPATNQRAAICHVVNGIAAVCDGPLVREYLARVVKANGLRLVPYSDDTRAGVHVDVHTAYKLRLLRNGRPKESNRENPWCLYYEGYRASPATRVVRDWRAFWLWLLEKDNRSYEASPSRRPATSWGGVLLDERSRSTSSDENVVTTSSNTVRVRYVHGTRLFCPKIGIIPPHLSAWSDELYDSVGRRKAA